MDTKSIDQSERRTAVDPVAGKHRIPLLARLSGRDRDILALCRTDTVAQSSNLGTALLVSALLHAAGVVAALVILNVGLQLALIIALITATGLFAMDRIAVNAIDSTSAEQAVRRIGATDLPRLESRWHGVFTPMLRMLFSWFTAVFIGGAATLYFFATDAADELERRQIAVDKPLMAEAQTQLDTERDVLKVAIEQANGPVEARAARIAEQQAARKAKSTAEIADVEIAQLALASLQQRLAAAEKEAATQRDRMRCEVAGVTETCPHGTGIEGRGRQYILSRERAEEAEAEIERLIFEIGGAERKLRDARELLKGQATSRALKSDDSDLVEDERVLQASQALANFDRTRTERAADLVAANPLRQVINPDSLANRLSALRALADRDPAFLAFAIAVKLFAFALEMMAFICAHFMSRSDYHVLKGRALADLCRDTRNRYRQSYLDDSSLGSRFKKTNQDEARDQWADDIFYRSVSGMN